MIGAGEIALDPSLIAYVDTLGLQAIQDISEADTIDLRLANGSGEHEDTLLEILDIELRCSTEAYVTELEKFLSISPDYGLPSFVFTDRMFTHQPPLHQTYGEELEEWLRVAKRHLPGAEGEAMDEIVACIVDPNLFLPLNFELAIEEPPSDQESYDTNSARDTLKKCGQRLASATTEQLCDFATSVETIQRFVDSSFMQTFGDDSHRAMLNLRILTLQGEPLQPDHYTLVANTIDTNSYHVLARHLRRVLECSPDVIAHAVVEHPRKPFGLHIIGRTVLELIRPQDRVEKYYRITTEIEKQVSDDLWHYGRFIEEHLRETETFEPEHIHRLKELVEAAEAVEPTTFEVMRVLDVLCANLPIGELSEFADKYPVLVRSFAAAPVCVRRFAADGQVERAFDIARGVDGTSTYRDVLKIAHKLLSIYDETGHEAAYLEAEQLVQGIQDKRVEDREIHKVLVHIFTAARRHGHTERAERARLSMEPYYTHAYADTRHECLNQRVHIALDDGDLQDAEYFAALLYASKPQSPGTTGQEKEMYSSAALLHVLRAYMKVNDIDSATNLAKMYFATGKPYPILKQALAILKNEPYGPLPSLFGERVNAIADVMDPRR